MSADRLWEARKRVLACLSDVESLLEIADPTGEERYEDSDEPRVLDFLVLWQGRLKAANSILHELATGGDADVS